MLTKFLVSLKIIGKALVVHGMNDGEVNLFNAKTGTFLHKLNTNMIFRYPKNSIRAAIEGYECSNDSSCSVTSHDDGKHSSSDSFI